MIQSDVARYCGRNREKVVSADEIAGSDEQDPSRNTDMVVNGLGMTWDVRTIYRGREGWVESIGETETAGSWETMGGGANE